MIIIIIPFLLRIIWPVFEQQFLHLLLHYERVETAGVLEVIY